MGKDELIKFKTNLLFNEYKDTAFKNTESLKSKIGDLQFAVDFKELYAMIVNYQLDTYGEQLHKHEKQGLDYEHTSFKRIANGEMVDKRRIK